MPSPQPTEQKAILPQALVKKPIKVKKGTKLNAPPLGLPDASKQLLLPPERNSANISGAASGNSSGPGEEKQRKIALGPAKMSKVKERVKLNQGLKEAPRDESKKEEEEDDGGYSEEEFEQFNEEDDEEAKHFKRIKNALKKENVNARRKNDLSHNNSGLQKGTLFQGASRGPSRL